LVQLRTGHVPLHKHLHRIQVIESPICPTCKCEEESVLHYLLYCPTYDEQRGELQRELGRKAREPTYLLTSPHALPHLFRYIAQTGRFAKSHG
ncbi:hypothetical protein PUNSTDRAFT_31042, partial [Punctularia strigosozonata HHB-11173 SS5]|uniref:uncharacterized protein n=1 Tax=Punctularia strigosozonata (strain HHB-11173) TaxID=741275 RepID=UPI00044186F7